MGRGGVAVGFDGVGGGAVSRTVRDLSAGRKRLLGGMKARGISSLKRLFQRSNRRYQDQQQRTSDDPLIEAPKRIRNFWWEWN